MSLISKNLKKITAQIRAAEDKFSRQPNSVSLLAASKGQSIEKIKEAIAAGHRAFGENYLQEALFKITKINHPGIEWHFIGPIQSNKTKKIAEQFSWVHSVSKIRIAKRLNDQRPSHLPPLNICLQINISAEPSKFGVRPCDLDELAAYCISLKQIKLRGLMAVPANKKGFKEQLAQFHSLRLLYELNKKKYNLDTLSMGMSEDFEAAIAEGATIIRIGTAIFGTRK